MVLLGLIRGVTLEAFLLSIATPMLPVVIWGVREYRENTDIATSLKRLRDHCEQLYRRAVAKEMLPEQLTNESRELQEGIFDLRRKNPPVFDWIYRRLKPRQEGLMVKGAEELVNEALENR
jgi:hypothetical protein